MSSNSHQTESKENEMESSQLFSGEKIRSYFIVMLGVVVITALYYCFLGGINLGTAPRNPPPENPSGNPGGLPPDGGGIHPSAPFDIWPLWGQFVLPSLVGISVAILTIFVFSGVVLYLKKKETHDLRIPVIILVGVILTILTNLIQGWDVGIVMPIGGQGEILSDAVQVVNPLSFIIDFEELQSTLSVHAQTQPPGAVLTIYVFYVVFQYPDLISIALCVVSSVFSVYFMNGVYKRLFDHRLSKYALLLFVVLPAIQVYYLANIYAIVSTLFLGLLYFYFHPNSILSLVGSFLCLFLGTFISFLFVYSILFLFIFELLQLVNRTSNESILNWVKLFLRSQSKLLAISIGVVFVYIGMALFLDFNYVATFLYAASSENPQGFMLLVNPLQYVVTRIQDVLDIIIFFGPILTILSYEGLVWLRANRDSDSITSTKYNLVVSALVALLLLFLTGAPRKGETARICMFILPLLLIPVITLLQKKNVTWKEKILLLVVVFTQTMLMQTVGIYVW